MIEQISTDEFYVQRYEELRTCIMSTDCLPIDTWGLNVLMRYGMARWMRAWDECPVHALDEPSAGSEGPVLVPGTWEAEVTIILSNIAMNFQEEGI